MDTALDVLAVESYSPLVEILAQIEFAEDRDIMFDSAVDVIVTHDDYKANMIGRNASCPGFSTLIEQLISSRGATLIPSTDPKTGHIIDLLGWQVEYSHGSRQSTYLFTLPTLFLLWMDYDWQLITEAIFMEFGAIAIGVASRSVIIF
jgi:Calcium-activated BK potassium channel alpha subunit